jgi:hypothetical protein
MKTSSKLPRVRNRSCQMAGCEHGEKQRRPVIL